MASVLTTIAFEAKSGKPEDRFVNTFVHTTPSPAFVNAEWDQILLDLDAFYNAVQTGTSRSIAAFIGSQVDRTALKHTASAYVIDGHLDGSAHGSPVRRAGFTLGPPTAGPANMPSEVAICLTFHSAYATDPEFMGTTRPRARDRGRIYIGPLNDGGKSVDANGRVLVGSAYRDTFSAAAVTHMNASGHAWSVWSRANQTVDPVVGGWVDDAFDIQRRRGEDASARTMWGTNV